MTRLQCRAGTTAAAGIKSAGAGAAEPAALARRGALLAAVAAAALALAPPVVAQEVRRMSQAAAAYQDHPQNGFRCALCTAFRAPHSCLIVEGRISPDGWCKFFDLGD